MSGSNITVVPIDLQHRPSNSDADVKSLVWRLVAVEDKIDAENKLKALIYAEAKVSGADIGALKAAVRIVRYLPQSDADNLPGLSETVKSYLDIINSKRREAN
jgi:uncharacterized protein (UPF0335 family)